MKTVERHRYNKEGQIFQTRTLTFEPYPMTEIESVIGLISSNLTPDLVTKKYREENASNPMFGHCYHSSQALYYLMDTNVLEQRTAIDYHDCSHWWLVLTPQLIRCMILLLINTIMLVRFLHTLTGRKNRGMVGRSVLTKDL